MKDLTKLTEAFGLLDDETREALKAHGGPYEWLTTYGEWQDAYEIRTAGFVYRVKHVPVEGWFNIYRFDLIYGPYPTKAAALAFSGPDCIRTIHMREVKE